jgi:hypothetical protein
VTPSDRPVFKLRDIEWVQLAVKPAKVVVVPEGADIGTVTRAIFKALPR